MFQICQIEPCIPTISKEIIVIIFRIYHIWSYVTIICLTKPHTWWSGAYFPLHIMNSSKRNSIDIKICIIYFYNQCFHRFYTVHQLKDHTTLVICSSCNIHFDTENEANQHRKKHNAYRTCQHKRCNRQDLFYHQNQQHGGE